jgi:hypothetical protein
MNFRKLRCTFQLAFVLQDLQCGSSGSRNLVYYELISGLGESPQWGPGAKPPEAESILTFRYIIWP